jgi:DNA polymerase I-like protein with 3'-5' exonuclease and polymerase domains
LSLEDVLIFDTEATTYEIGNPFSRPNKLMCVGTLLNGVLTYHDIEHSGEPYGESLRQLRALFAQARLVVGFNLKYDLHWIRKYIPDIVFPPCHDVQLGEFILSKQLNAFPSLDDVLTKYGLPLKLNLIKTKYWDNGLDTTEATQEELSEYVLHDVVSTKDAYLRQIEDVLPGQKNLIWLHNQDLLTLQECEFNGMLFNEQECRRLDQDTQHAINQLLAQLCALVPSPVVNWDSPGHISAVLFGGGINYDGRETVQRVLKNGRIKTYDRNCTLIQDFPRLVDPVEGSETEATAKLTNEVLRDLNKIRKSQGKPLLHRRWSTAAENLMSLRAEGLARQIIDLLLKLAQLDKLVTTYYRALPALVERMQWNEGMLHGQFNQCIAITGRLSSSKPNLQNQHGDIKVLFESRYA